MDDNGETSFLSKACHKRNLVLSIIANFSIYSIRKFSRKATAQLFNINISNHNLKTLFRKQTPVACLYLCALSSNFQSV